MNKKIIKWILAILWMIFIFVMSTNIGSASNTIHVLKQITLKIPFIKVENLSTEDKVLLLNMINFILRKSAHVGEYFILSILLVSLVKEYEIKRNKIIFVVISCSFIYATFDEIHQLFVISRTGNTKDVIFDVLGAFFGTLICFISYKKRLRSF